jgi:hypothetical protein
MPKMTRRNKRDGSRIRDTNDSCLSNQTDSVKKLLSKLTPNLKRVSAQAARQNFWRDWLDTHLPQEIRERLTGVVEREGVLVIFTESAAWSARLRYLVQEMEAQIRAADPKIIEVNVRVLPRGAKQ